MLEDGMKDQLEAGEKMSREDAMGCLFKAKDNLLAAKGRLERHIACMQDGLPFLKEPARNAEALRVIAEAKKASAALDEYHALAAKSLFEIDAEAGQVVVASR